VKQFIVLTGMIAFGIFIYLVVAGPDSDSIKGITGSLWQTEVSQQSEIYR